MSKHNTSKSDSDSSDDSITPLCEPIRCILCSSSSSEESVDSPRESRNVGAGQIVSHIESEHPGVLELIKTLYIEDRDKAYFSYSLMEDWGIKGRGSSQVQFDVLIVSHNRPVTILSFVKTTENEEKLIKYNTKVARFVVSEVRKHLYGSFSLVSGVIDLKSCQSEDKFKEEIRSLEDDARLCSVPGWLHMNTDRYKRLVQFFDEIHSKVNVFERETAESDTTSVCEKENEDRQMSMSSGSQYSVFQTTHEPLRRSHRRRKGNFNQKGKFSIPKKRRIDVTEKLGALSVKTLTKDFSFNQSN